MIPKDIKVVAMSHNEFQNEFQEDLHDLKTRPWADMVFIRSVPKQIPHILQKRTSWTTFQLGAFPLN